MPIGSVVHIKEGNNVSNFKVARHNAYIAERTLLVRSGPYTKDTSNGKRAWGGYTQTNYAGSSIDYWLNNTYLKLLPENIQEKVEAVPLPYTPGGVTSSSKPGFSDAWKVSTYSAKVFLLSATEYGLSGTVNKEGEALDASIIPYASDAQWTRSPSLSYSSENIRVWVCTRGPSGTTGSIYASYEYYAVPAFTLPSSIMVDEENNIITNIPPAPPASITVPTTVLGGKTLTISCGAASDTDGSISGYIFERAYNGGTFEQIYKGINRSYTDTITFGWTSVQYRVKAYDDQNAESDYTTSPLRDVINSSPPAIDGTNEDLGLLTGEFTQTYTVTNPDTELPKTLTVVENIDGKQKRSYTATSGAVNTFTMSAADWLEVTNGSHTLAITVTDNYGDSATRQYTFSKSVSEIEFTLSTPLAADAAVTKGIMNIPRQIPIGADFTVEVCNNAFDATPTWEDVTAAIIGGSKFFLSNAVKTAANWGFNIRVKVNRQSAIGDCFIQGIGGNFE